MPAMMRVHRSNRTEALVEVLAHVVREPVGGPTEPECIVVQGRGMERWLSMELAKRLGVWANPDFPFPRRIVERALHAVLGEEHDGARIFEPEALLWSVADVLPGLLARPEFEAIRSYLADDDRGRRLFQLAERIANTFDHYTVYRPQMVLGWEDGRDSHWQAALWRTLVERHGAHHLARRSQTFLQRLQRGAEPASDFPRRLCLFGISTLPPLYLQVLGALSGGVELHLFLLRPAPVFLRNF
jgi:exodeoxyribonuclease V gamma subunit